MRVVLKQCVWERVGDDLVVILDPREALTLADPDGHVEALLAMLSRAAMTAAEVGAALASQGRRVSEADIESALAGLDSLGLVDDGDGLELGDAELDARHTSNLAFFSGYSRLSRPRSGFIRKLREAHVLVLGVGGGSSNVLMGLVGLGVGRFTLVDGDHVEPRNFARQFVYRHVDIGRSKVDRAAEWVRQYDPAVRVRAVNRWISGPADLADLVDGVDLIVGGIDTPPPDAQLWVNDAAVRAGVPLVAGGLSRSRLVYYSVHPGHGPCRRCDERVSQREPAAAGTEHRLVRELRVDRNVVNSLIGPLAMQIGSQVAYEALRYLTGFEPPRAAGAYVVLDLRTGLLPVREPFSVDPECPICPLAPAGPEPRRMVDGGVAGPVGAS